jgi:peptide/nickel transport system substrate-binding protein
MVKKKVFAAASAALIAMLSFGPLAAQTMATHVDIGATSGAVSLDPWGVSFFQLRQVYDPLIEYADDGTLVGALAERWEYLDPGTLQIVLREGVTFSDGEPLTADTIAYNIERLNTSTNPAHSLLQQRLNIFPSAGMGITAEIVDARTVNLSPAFPDPLFDRRLTGLFIVPQAFTDANEGLLDTAANGTGYFAVTDFVPGQTMRFEAWGGSWRGEHAIQTATYAAIPDPAALLAALQTGEIDAALGLPPDIARSVTEDGTLAVTAQPSYGIELVSFVSDIEPLFNDVNVRRAFNLAVNKEEYNAIVLGGFGTVPTGQFLEPGIEGFNPTLEAYPYDPETARALLEDAGAAGMNFTLATTIANQSRAEAVAGYLQAVGVNATIEIQDFQAFVGSVLRGATVPGLLWTPFYTRLASWAEVTRYNPPPPGMQMQSFFTNDEFAALSAQLGMTFDPAERDAIGQQIMQIAHDEAPALFLSHPQVFWVHNPAIADLPMAWDTSLRLWEIEMPE